MVTRLKILGAIALLSAGYGANGAAPPIAGGRNIVPPSLPASTTSGQSGSTASPDGKAHVTLQVSLNLTKLNPLATRGEIICFGAVDDWQAMATKVSNVTSTVPSTTYPAAAPANYVPIELVYPLSQLFPSVQMQSATFALNSGSYTGTQSVNFAFTPDQLVGMSLPAFMGVCALELGDNVMHQATMDTSGSVVVPTSQNVAFVMTGQAALIVFAQVQFVPL